MVAYITPAHILGARAVIWLLPKAVRAEKGSLPGPREKMQWFGFSATDKAWSLSSLPLNAKQGLFGYWTFTLNVVLFQPGGKIQKRNQIWVVDEMRTRIRQKKGNAASTLYSPGPLEKQDGVIHSQRCILNVSDLSLSWARNISLVS